MSSFGKITQQARDEKNNYWKIVGKERKEEMDSIFEDLRKEVIGSQLARVKVIESDGCIGNSLSQYDGQGQCFKLYYDYIRDIWVAAAYVFYAAGSGVSKQVTVIRNQAPPGELRIMMEEVLQKMAENGWL